MSDSDVWLFSKSPSTAYFSQESRLIGANALSVSKMPDCVLWRNPGCQ